MPAKHELLQYFGTPKSTKTSASRIQTPRILNELWKYIDPRESSSSRSETRVEQPNIRGRLPALWMILYCLFGAVILRLFYWQVSHRTILQAEAEDQYTRTITVKPHRGSISTADGFTLVNNQRVYRLYAQPKKVTQAASAVAKLVAPYLIATESASTAAELTTKTTEMEATLTSRIASDKTWVSLAQNISGSTKEHIANLKIEGLGFEEYEIRAYPESSLAAKVVGFVGKDKDGNDQGYFGVEGALDGELTGQTIQKTYLRDATGAKLLFGNTAENPIYDGRSVVLTIRRDIQHMAEEMLKEGIEKYQAKAGEIIIMEPSTGKILAMASWPTYEPSKYSQYDAAAYKNPSVADTYEPGSIFKVLTVAAGIDAGQIHHDTVCPNCEGPRKIAQYTLKTWNEEYHPNITMEDALAKSDNVAMIFIAEKLGVNRFVDYMKKFGIGEATGVELQEDTSTPLRKNWVPVDLATSSFGQGIATTGLQMVRAVGAIANQGKLMRPSIIEKVIDPTTNTEVKIEPQESRQVVSSATAAEVTQMMVHSAQYGEAQWTDSKSHLAAGKTGTAQIPVNGVYDPEKTNASFIGFAPPTKPKFVMLVKLQEPQSSPWAAETAAPLWYRIADRLYLMLNIPPDR